MGGVEIAVVAFLAGNGLVHGIPRPCRCAGAFVGEEHEESHDSRCDEKYDQGLALHREVIVNVYAGQKRLCCVIFARLFNVRAGNLVVGRGLLRRNDGAFGASGRSALRPYACINRRSRGQRASCGRAARPYDWDRYFVKCSLTSWALRTQSLRPTPE